MEVVHVCTFVRTQELPFLANLLENSWRSWLESVAAFACECRLLIQHFLPLDMVSNDETSLISTMYGFRACCSRAVRLTSTPSQTIVQVIGGRRAHVLSDGTAILTARPALLPDNTRNHSEDGLIYEENGNLVDQLAHHVAETQGSLTSLIWHQTITQMSSCHLQAEEAREELARQILEDVYDFWPPLRIC
ncbi:hypothetical protein U1Q18_044762 [Sarracenia purpurea var. burkii]